jgi:hypothetical protein
MVDCRCGRKDKPHNHVDMPPLVTLKDTGVCIPTGNSEVLLAAIYKSSGCAWNGADIIELLSFILKALLAGDLNYNYPFSNCVVSKPSLANLLNLLDINIVTCRRVMRHEKTGCSSNDWIY